MTRQYVKKINYPCQTAAIFQDVIYVMRPASASELLAEADKASEFYLNYFPFATLEDISNCLEGKNYGATWWYDSSHSSFFLSIAFRMVSSLRIQA
nr:hypothetical protein [Klebsiella pneumoniae]